MSAGASIENYTPKNIPAKRWEVIKPFCVKAGTRFMEERPQEVRKFMGHLSALVYWAHYQMCYDLDEEQIFDNDVINCFIHDSAKELSHGSLSTRRTTVTKIAQLCHPCWNGSYGYAKNSGSDPSAPYKDKEISLIYDWTTSNDPFARAERQKLVALGFGAGLSSGAMCSLKWSSVVRDEFGTVIHLEDRLIPMREFDADTLEELRGDDDSYVLRPRVKSRTPDDVVQKSLRGYDNGMLRPVVRRMRVTWIVGLMNTYIPDAAICSAAGFKSLKKYEKYRPDFDVMVLRRQFHGNLNDRITAPVLRVV
ncbi:integrase [Corynebacterium phoceense]|uniref:integrase n=1 Tax=Corynebacterium phoceense TaxID=1686286 RepID=UPI00211CCE22|nr:integrase [Corynebacterium phoceense]MCQ9336919.1 integrase [Corynebacterium phoceense]